MCFERFFMGLHQQREECGLPLIEVTFRTSCAAGTTLADFDFEKVFDNASWPLFTGGAPCFSKKHPVHIMDRANSHGSFAAGVIYSDLNGYDPGAQSKVTSTSAPSAKSKPSTQAMPPAGSYADRRTP